MDDTHQEWEKSTWRIHPAINAPGLEPEVVQFALLESDPMKDFRTILTQDRERYRNAIKNVQDPRQRLQLKAAQMAGTWDRLFKAITGDQVYLLVPSTNKKIGSMAKTHVISSNSPAGTKWLATKIAFRNETPTCWSIRVETAIGKSVKIDLLNENAIDIAKLFDEIMGAL